MGAELPADQFRLQVNAAVNSEDSNRSSATSSALVPNYIETNGENVDVSRLRSADGMTELDFNTNDGLFTIKRTGSSYPIWKYGADPSEWDLSPPFRLALQTDHHLVVYNADNQAVWATHTFGLAHGPAVLFLCDSGSCHLLGRNKVKVGPTHEEIELWTSRQYVWSVGSGRFTTTAERGSLATEGSRKHIEHPFHRDPSSERRTFMSLKVRHSVALSVLKFRSSQGSYRGRRCPQGPLSTTHIPGVDVIASGFTTCRVS